MGTGSWRDYGNVLGLVTGYTGISGTSWNYQQQLMAAQQQAQPSLDYWRRHAGCPGPGPTEYPVVPAVPDGYQPIKMSELLDDPFRQLCNHDFHALLDKFKGMRAL